MTNITASRRALLSGVVASTALAASGATASAAGSDSELLVLCERLQRLNAEQTAVYARSSAAHERAEASVPIPPEISAAALTHDDFYHLEPREREMRCYGGVIPGWMLATVIDRSEARGSRIEDASEPDCQVIRIHKTPASADDLARAGRLRQRLAVLNRYDDELDAARKREGYSDDNPRALELGDEINDLESELVLMECKTAAGLLAKLAIWKLDPDQYNDSAEGEISVAESIMRDIPIVLGVAV